MKRIALFAIALAACSDPVTVLPDAGMQVPDARAEMDAAAPDPDAAEPPPEDAGVPEDASVPAAARQFVTRPMFGEGRVDNLVFDPVFDLPSYNWYAISADGSAVMPVEKQFLPFTPLHQPALHVPKPMFSRGAYLIGSGASESSAVEVSIWVARTIKDAATTDMPAAAIVGVGPTGPEVSWDLVEDGTSRVERDGLTWVKLRTSVNGALGVLTFLSGDDGGVEFWVSSPAITPINAARIGAGTLAARAVNAREKALIEKAGSLRRAHEDPRKRPRGPR